MKVAEFRALTADMLRLVNDWQACVDGQEQSLWRERAHRFLAGFMSASCDRATPRDHEARLSAYQQYIAIVVSTTATMPLQRTSTSRAGRYNKSPARAVRLARASRSCMRRGYF
ncbi:hypothetical protein HMPREF1487_09521 [Pseudomonas sp. HPB0071]|uniref:Uncharacterized protein n=1 Tax=Pseudomonas luteola TaxID=47886 RepID=A0A2X2BUH2_PSELU|nr:hypothetical protein HMPREF1487_09521 [Pseudomonas sp. HPB0071]SPZ00022.1 Uncharacterised protein [Pseudomonas luteola]